MLATVKKGVVLQKPNIYKMKKPKKLTLKHYWKANSSFERQEIVENAFKWIEFLELKENE